MDLSIVIAAYNEKENIGRLIEALNKICKENKINNEIIIVDDSSPDGTSGVILEYKKRDKNIMLISRPPKSGIGSAYGDGVKSSRGIVIITMDADFSHSPSALVEMYRKAKEGYIVSGSRFLKKGGFSTKFYRKIGTTLLNLWIRTLFNTGIKDHTNGYIAVNKENLNKIIKRGIEKRSFPFKKTLYGIPIFAIAKVFGFKVCEVFAPYKFREVGETKINFFDGLSIVLNDSWYAFKLFFRLKNDKF